MKNIQEADVELAREAMEGFTARNETVQAYKRAVDSIQDITEEEIQEIEPQLAKARKNRQEYRDIAETEFVIFRKNRDEVNLK